MLSLPISGGPPFTNYVSSASRASRRRFVTFRTSQGKGSFDDPVIMVDPVEAKRLAAKQMQEIKAKEKLKVRYHGMRRRQAEAINGALAMIGLTAGLVIEGQTGKGILGQLAGYLATFVSLFIQ
ncbi:hypothetical protein ZIOFF_039622 [Zingiber officinale]|uniref:Uncharacterized protein n=1 Tax=Zingiber officinale TaxID=94328 RepID=A0A8J5L0B2_ZINOF|nr:hypothetical protein ZIOFF_039622 [Zingiber officinale]